MSRPNWELIENLGDAKPLEYGGYFVYRDTTGVYCDEAELLEVDEELLEKLEDVASYAGISVAELIDQLCSADPLQLANAYRDIGSYHGWDNLDPYPLELTKEEAEERYAAVK